MNETILFLGIACIIAAVVGGGLEAMGIKIPPLRSLGRQCMLAGLGLILVLGAKVVPGTPHNPNPQLPTAPFKGTMVPTPDPQPTPPKNKSESPKVDAADKPNKGYFVVDKKSSIRKVEDLRGGDRICVSKSGAEFLRTLSPFSELDLRVVSAPDIYPALQKGGCIAVFVFQREDANRLLPVGITNLRLMPVYDQ